MISEKLIYRLFLVMSLLTLLVSVLSSDHVIFLKPAVIVLLCALYLTKTKQKNYWVVFSMFLIMVLEILTNEDLKRYFRELTVLLSFYYIINIILLWKSFKKIKVQFKKVFTVQLIITMLLIIYVLFSVAHLILPQVNEHKIYLIVLIVCFTSFIGFCYHIYLNSKTIISSSLMVAASCFLIVNIITALNGLYLSLGIFSLIINLLQISGQFFIIKFYIEQQYLTPVHEDYF